MTPAIPGDPTRVLLAGDTHGDGPWFAHLVALARQHRVAGIVQLGDFGYWPHEAFGQRYLTQVDALCTRARLWCLWLDGNHEDFDALAQEPVRDDGFTVIRPRLLHAPRGHRWTWAGVRFLAVGGAASLDRALRLPGRSWWPQEVLTDAQVATAIAGGPTDVLLTHDAPAAVPLLGAVLDPPSEANRARLQTVLDATRPRWLAHGHWHFHYRTVLVLDGDHEVDLVGLDGNQGHGTAAVLDWRGGPDTITCTVVD